MKGRKKYSFRGRIWSLLFSTWGPQIRVLQCKEHTDDTGTGEDDEQVTRKVNVLGGRPCNKIPSSTLGYYAIAQLVPELQFFPP